MKAVILLSVLAVAFATECGENEHFESCGTACPLTCENYQNPPKFCVLMCNIGCHCDKGYVRSADGRCVKPEECPAAAFPKVCGENERFETCGTACPLTCDNYQNPPKACVKRCDIGCHCEEGYVRAANGKCVKPEECPASAPMQCEENQHYEECGTACPLTCKNFDNPPKVCVMMCRSGCFCDKGFVKTDDGKCVRPEQCPEQALELCMLPPERGMCKGYFPRYHFDPETGKCEKFIYGGCRGNENNFNTLEECQAVCGSS